MANFTDQDKNWGGLNLDDSDLNINYTPNGEKKGKVDYRNARNIRTAINAAKRGGALTNVLSNLEITTYILPYTGGMFPTGRNRCVGARQVGQDSVLFFVWNSEGKNQILRYYKEKTDPNNPYGVVEQVMMYQGTGFGTGGKNMGWGWNRNTRITAINTIESQGASDGYNPRVPGDLTYWSDPMPHMIDIDRANICGKLKSWIFYAPYYSFNSFGLPSTFVFTLSNFANVALFTATVVMPVSAEQPDGTYTFNGNSYVNLQASNAACLSYLATQINLLYPTTISAEANGGTLIITEVSPTLSVASFNYAYTGTTQLKMYAYNWYGTELQDRYFDRCMWQPMDVPRATYGTDDSYVPNNVQNNVFQFRLLNTYTCASPSAPGLWSGVPINNLQCDGSNNPLLNFIDVDFNDIDLVDDSTLVLFNQVWFIVRLRNTTIGTDKVVIQLDPGQFLDYNGTDWFCHYRFFNNISSTPLDPFVSAQLFDDVPRTSVAQLENAGLIIEGNVDTGLEAPANADIDFKVQITEVSAKKRWKVTGKIRVLTYPLQYYQVEGGSNRNFYTFFPPGTLSQGNKVNPAPISTYPFFNPSGTPNGLPPSKPRGGIFHDISRTENDFPYFGGGGFNGNDQFRIRAGMEDTYDQRIPEAGWPVYAAGTNYFTVSKQITVGLSTDAANALDTSTNVRLDAIGVYYRGVAPVDRTDLYSTFELNLPNGTYLIRLGSHWCSFGDVLEKGFPYDLNAGTAYQKTSTNVCGMYNTSGQFVATKEILIVVNDGDVDVGDFVVMDIAPPSDAEIDVNGDKWQPITGYLYDSTANPLGQSNTDMNADGYDGISVEKTLINYGGALAQNWADIATTDHNGYWFGIAGKTNAGYNDYPIRAYQVGSTGPRFVVSNNTLLWIGTLTDLYNKTLRAEEYAASNGSGGGLPLGLIICCITTDTSSARQLCSTIISGSIQNSNGDPVSGALAVYTNGKTAVSSENGQYQLVAWGDMIFPNLGEFPLQPQDIQTNNSRITDVLIFSLSQYCDGDYPNGQFEFPNIVTFGDNQIVNHELPNVPPFTPYSWYNILPFVINENLFAVAHSLKRGGEYLAGLRVNDYSGRLSTVVGAGSIYIPFHTEDLSLYPYVVDGSGNPYPAGTYLFGQPKILWNFNNGMNPPVGAASYDIMLTKDLFYGNYIQWIIKQVQYVSQLPTADQEAISTSFLNADAVGVLIDIGNMGTYNSQHPAYNYTQPTIGYTWTLGDRIRIILDRDNNLIESPSANLGQTGQVYDFLISGITATNQLILANPSLPFEIKGGFTVEIYTPARLNPTETQILYEVGEHYDCTNPGGSNNAYGTTSGELTCGDTYWRSRFIIVNDSLTEFVGVYSAIIEAQDISDNYPSVADDTGRSGVINPANTPLSQKTKMLCSGRYLPDGAINGLSTFNPNQPVEAVIDPRYGAIVNMFYENNVLQVVCFNKNITAPINRNLMYQGQSEQSVVSLSGQFFDPLNFRIEAKDLGAEIGASIAHNNGIIFGLNTLNANVWKWFGSDEEVISDRKMITFFKQLQNDGVLDAVAVYDKFYEEYVLTYWRKYVVSGIPNFKTAPGTYTFQMPTSQPPYNPLYGRLGQTPEVGSDLTFSIKIAGVTYGLTGTVQAVELNIVTGLWRITVALDAGQAIASAISLNTTVSAQYTFGLPETITWNEGTELMKSMGDGQVWRSWLDLTPENYAALGADICTFKNGRIWISAGQGVTPTTQRNTFFGTFYNSIIAPIFNGVQHQHNVIPKIWNALTMWLTQGSQVGGGNRGSCNFYSNPNEGSGTGVQNMYGQQSRLNKANWVYNEGHWSIEFQRDLNDISVPIDASNPANPLGNRVQNGMVLRSEALTVELINDSTSEIVLYSAKGNYTLSAGPIR